MATAANGVVIGKDVTLKNMPPAELALLPKGIDAVVPWDFTNSLIIDERKSGRAIDISFPYNMYQGSVYVRQELVDNVPDVVKAIAEAVVEATLWIRANPAKAIDAMLEEPNLKNVPRALLTASRSLRLRAPSATVSSSRAWRLVAVRRCRCRRSV